MKKTMTRDQNQSFPSLTFARPLSKDRADDQPSYTPEDMATAIEEACRKTELRVEEETRKTLSEEQIQRQTEALEAIRHQLQSNDVLFEQWLSEATLTIRQLAKMIGQALVPKALEQAPLADIETIIRQSLLQLLGQPKIEISLGTKLSEDEQDRFEKMREETGFLGEFKVMTDSQLDPGDAKLIWRGGSIERDLEKLRKEADDIVDAWILGDADNHLADQMLVESN